MSSSPARAPGKRGGAEREAVSKIYKQELESEGFSYIVLLLVTVLGMSLVLSLLVTLTSPFPEWALGIWLLSGHFE